MLKITDEQIVSAMLASSTNADAAKSLGINERYLYKRLTSENLQRLLKDAQLKLLEFTITEMRRNLQNAAAVMIEIMLDSNTAPQTRLNAAAALQNNYLRLSERQDVTERLDRLERLYGV